MTGRKLSLAGLVVVVVLGCLCVAACGDSGASTTTSADSTTTTLDPVTIMQDALSVVEADMVGLTGSVASGEATGADMKEALILAAPHWQAVVDACEGVGADATEAQQLWSDLETAVNKLPDSAGLMQMASVAAPAGAIQNYIAALREQVGRSGGDVVTTVTGD